MKYFLPVLFLGLWSLRGSAQRNCSSYEYLQQQLQADPVLAQKMAAFEASRGDVILNGTAGSGIPAPAIIKIPVVVHVLYNTAAQNISEAQIRSQIEALNKDFRRTNADTIHTPAGFRHLAADCQIEFELAKTDPLGRPTNGITRKHTSYMMYGLDDRIKSSKTNGQDGWDSDHYLNIWVGNLAGGMLGFASTLGGRKEVDGIVITPTAFGTTGIAAAPFNKGRTATHEVGHWLGLRHIWGDTFCGDDHIEDTPPQRAATRNCPTGVVITCDNNPTGNMYTNFMDFTDDVCMNLFTQGQRSKMRSQFLPGGAHYALLSSSALTGKPVPGAVQPGAEAPPPEPEPVIRVYPNPVSSFLSVSADKEEAVMGKTVSLRNHQGQLALQFRITKGSSPVSIQHLPKGLYYLRVEGCGQVIKVLKGE